MKKSEEVGNGFKKGGTYGAGKSCALSYKHGTPTEFCVVYIPNSVGVPCL